MSDQAHVHYEPLGDGGATFEFTAAYCDDVSMTFTFPAPPFTHDQIAAIYNLASNAVSLLTQAFERTAGEGR